MFEVTCTKVWHFGFTFKFFSCCIDSIMHCFMITGSNMLTDCDDNNWLRKLSSKKFKQSVRLCFNTSQRLPVNMRQTEVSQNYWVIVMKWLLQYMYICRPSSWDWAKACRLPIHQHRTCDNLMHTCSMFESFGDIVKGISHVAMHNATPPPPPGLLTRILLKNSYPSMLHFKADYC